MSKTYTPIHVHSYYSILDGFGSPKANVARAKKLGLTALGMTDHGNVFGHIDFWNQCKKAGIKPLLGCELYVVHQSAAIKTQENRANSHMVCWAKNKDGWLNLLKLVSKTNDPDYYYYKPRISLSDFTDETGTLRPGLESFVGKDRGIMAFSGHQGSHLSDNLFCDLFGDPEQRRVDIRRAYGQYKETDLGFYKKFLRENWLESTSELALRLNKMFGEGNFFIELQNELNKRDRLALNIHPLIVECLREVSKVTGIPSVASSDPHYPSPEDSVDQRMMVSVNMKETEESIQEKLDSSDEQDVMVFFGSDNFYIHSYEEMSEKFTVEELEMSNKIAEQVEIYDITHKPYVPKYTVPEFDKSNPCYDIAPTEQDKYLMHLCIEGAKKLQPWTNIEWTKGRPTRELYWKRLVEEEFPVIFKAELSNYFLVVWDYCMAGDFRPKNHKFDWQENLRNNGELDPIPRGVGRGSAAGCLISYLIGITGIDPILYGLNFTRFYSEGRNTKDHIELPDIDIDFAVEDRDWIISYLSNKYGKENVAQIITFQRIQGRAAVKDIFRVKGVNGGFELSNEICKFIPNEAEIADEIQAMREAGNEGYGILQWALDNSDELREFYKRDDLKPLFDQAIRCEGVKRGQGKHPSGVIVVPKPVEECFPMTLDTKTKERIIGVDFNDVAKMGGVKMDILGTAVLDKLKMCQDLVNGIVPKRNRVEDFLDDE